LEKVREKIDQALRERVEQSHDNDVIEALLTYDLSAEGGARADAVAQSIVDDAARRIGIRPASVHVFPQLGAMHVTARTALLRQLLADDRVSTGTVP